MKHIKTGKERTKEDLSALRKTVSEIIEDVVANGDAALRSYSEKFDGFARPVFRVSREEINDAYSHVSEQELNDMKTALANIRTFAEAQRATIHDLPEFQPRPGILLGHRVIPVQSCCCYVPGGRFPLYSSAMMLITPAKVAGVKRIVTCSPVAHGTGTINDKTLVAMDLAGADEIYALGGVQAIAAFSYGTESILPVDVIVGPGNQYVAEAKRQCYGQVGIDFVAGPSEVLVIADENAPTAIAGVMAMEPEVLLFDEPLANLDPATGKTAIDLIDRIQKQSQKTVVIIEHRLEDVLYRHVDRIVVVAEGRIVADMTPDELMATQQLSELGIREPLYVTAMKYAGISITPQMRAGQLQTLVIDDEIRRKIQAWCEKPVPTGRPAGEEILAVKHLSFQYTKSRKILQDVNFSIKSGEMVSIVGTNGAGKSTLAKVICGFVTEDAGEILFEGKSLKGQTIKERSQYISYVMQNPNQMICKPMIFDEVALGLRIRGELSEEEIRERVEHALKICGLYPFRKWPVSALSFGQKKRVTIASMLVMNPKVLILDEPTAGQDYRHYTEIMEFLKELNQQGVTIILITHDMHLMLEYTPHAIVINGGKKIGDSTAVDILTNEEIANAASLKLTSLYEFGLKLGLKDPQGLVQHFIDYEREVCRE